MAKLTQKQVAELQYTLRNLERARAYIMAPQVAIARRGEHATTTLHYTRSDGQTLYEVTKDYGSDLTGLDAGINALRHFLTVA